MSENTPLMEQYALIKQQYKNEVLFFRLGDFYEMFNQDAEEVSKLLNLTLTHRAGSKMCGIPYHAAKIYIARLLRCGKKIAICEQMNLPVNGKGLADRKVIEVITPGNVLEEEYLEKGSNNYLAALCFVKKQGGVQEASFSYADISTGAFYTVKWNALDTAEEFAKELGRVTPREIIISLALEQNEAVKFVLNQFPLISVTWEQDWHFSMELSYKKLLSQFGTSSLRAFSLTENSSEIASAGYILEYLSRTSSVCNPDALLPHITTLSVHSDNRFITIDESSRRNLEIIANLRDGSSKYSLLETVFYTVTAMGSRLIRNRLLYPVCDIACIEQRQQRICFFTEHRKILTKVHLQLAEILDIERLAGRIAMERAHAKDLQALRYSLENWISIRTLVNEFQLDKGIELETATVIADRIRNALVEDPSTLLTEGCMIKEGWSPELDHYKKIHKDFNKILDEYIEEEKAKTGIQNLKIRYNKNMGYYMEVSKGKLNCVPEHFILRRALVNGDRYTSIKLQELEEELVTAGEKIIETEKKLFLELRASLFNNIKYLKLLSDEIADLDVTTALAYAAVTHNWIRPLVDDSGVLDITGGRHPVVEYHLNPGEFVPNDTLLSDKYFALITGPNMAGKSTYLRQNALIVLLAQTGSFVPAEKAHIGVVDRIFCRVGASDNLARGESTFLVEMSETARILRSATNKSLVIMDEVGRGTSTEDGLSLAWAISEYLLNNIKAKTFFATHYHELTRLSHPALKLLCLGVLENEGQVVFLKRIEDGASANSYGLHVAKLAGVPVCVVERASEILSAIQKNTPHTELSSVETKKDTIIPSDEIKKEVDLTEKKFLCNEKSLTGGLFSDEELLLDEILSLEPDEITPLEALQKIARWKKILCNRK